MQHLIQFIHMGGYAKYVWPSYFIALIVLALNIYLPMRKQHDILRKVKGQQGSVFNGTEHASRT